jgi:hypothetical protein
MANPDFDGSRENVEAGIRRLLESRDPRRTLATVTLDVADSGILPTPTRIFLKDRVMPALERLGLGDRLLRFARGELHPGANGVFIVAGPGDWQAVQLAVPLRNFVRVGPGPYLPPLVDALDRWPRCYVVRYSEREARVEEFDVGAWSDVDARVPTEKRWIDVNPERLLTGRSLSLRSKGTAIGGGKRDRFEQTLETAYAQMLADLAGRLERRHAERPAWRIFVYGDPERLPYLRDPLSPALAARVIHLGTLSAREIDLKSRDRVRREVERLHAEAVEGDVRALKDRLARKKFAAAGPDLLSLAESGRIARAFVDAYDPLDVLGCPTCRRPASEPGMSCPACGEPRVMMSSTRELVAWGLTHPPLALTFVPGPAAWLREAGGMAALLSAKRLKRKRA